MKKLTEIVPLHKNTKPTLKDCLDNIVLSMSKHKDLSLKCKNMVVIYALDDESDIINYTVNYFVQSLRHANTLELIGLLEAIKNCIIVDNT